MNKIFDFFSSIISAVINRFVKLKGRKSAVGGRKKEVYSNVIAKIAGERFATPGISDLAIIAQTAIISESVTVSPGVYIGENVSIGDKTKIYPNVTILDDTTIEKNVVVESGSVIGGEGFGYYKENNSESFNHIPHIGKVHVKSDVHIGTNVSIHRSTVGKTIIGQGTKINSNVHIAHNVKIGKNCLIMTGVSISGSTTIGDSVVLNPQAAISKKVKIGNNAIVGMNSTVINDVRPHASVLGTPAKESKR